MDYLLDQTFKLFKSSNVPVPQDDDLSYISDNIANYLSINHKFDTNIAVNEIRSKIDFVQTTHHIDNYVIQLTKISLSDLMKPQIIVFVSDQNHSSQVFQSLILIKSSFAKILIQILENLPSYSEPSVISPHKLNSQYLREIIDAIAYNLSKFTEDFSLDRSHLNTLIMEAFGNIELNYAVNGNHLNKIAINVPKSDIKSLLDNADGSLNESLNQFMVKHTEIKFDKLSLAQFFSNLIFISSNGHIKIFKSHINHFNNIIANEPEVKDKDTEIDYKSNFIIFIIKSLHGKSLNAIFPETS